MNNQRFSECMANWAAGQASQKQRKAGKMMLNL